MASVVRCAERNARANGVAERCDFVAADATEWMSRKAGEKRFDVVLMDPPRAGSTPEFLHGVADLAPSAWSMSAATSRRRHATSRFFLAAATGCAA